MLGDLLKAPETRLKGKPRARESVWLSDRVFSGRAPAAATLYRPGRPPRPLPFEAGDGGVHFTVGDLAEWGMAVFKTD